MPKIPTQTFDLLREGQYVLRIKALSDPEKGEFQGEPQLQIIADLEVRESLSDGNNLMTDDETDVFGHTYKEYWSLDPRTGAVKKDSKLWQVYEAATGLKLDDDDEIDTDDLIQKDFQAKVVVNKPGTRNRTEHGTYGKVKRKKSGKDQGEVENKGQTTAEAEAEEANQADFSEIPF